MLKKILVCLFVLLTTKFLFVHAVTTNDIPSYAPSREKTISEIIDEKAKLYQVSSVVMHQVIKCESQYNPRAVGDGGHSRGLVQIYDDFHPTITHEQAFNPEFAITFLAKNLSQGKGSLWSCYRQLNLE